MVNMNPQQSTIQMDPQVIALAKAIRKTESNDNFNAKGKSGESGAYQWMPATWKEHAKEVLGDANAQMTPANQNAVAYTIIKGWKDRGLNPAQIAAKWNSGSEKGWENKIGTNAQGVSYNVPQYVKSVTDTYQQFKVGDTEAPQIPNSSTVAETPLEKPQTGFLGTNPNDSLYGKLIDNSITRGIQSFFPGEKVGQAIGTLGGYAASGFNPNYDTSAPTPLQVAGDVAQGALMVGTGMPSGSAGVQAFGKALPVMQTAATGLGRVGQASAIGAGFAGTGAIKEGDTDISSIAGKTALGGVAGVVAGGFSEGVSKFLSKIPETIMNQAFKAPLGEIKKGIKTGEDTFAKQALDRGIVGTNSQIYNKSINRVAQNEEALQEILTQFDKTAAKPGLAKVGEKPGLAKVGEKIGTISKKELVPYFKDLVTRLKDTPGMGDEVKIINKVFNSLDDTLSLSRANVIKRNLYFELGNPAYKIDANLSTKREAMKTLARGIKDLIEKKTGADSKTSSIVNHFNRELAFYGKLRDRAVTNMAKGANLNLNDYAVVGLGQLLGGPAMAMGSEVVKRGYGTTLAKTALAQGINKINKLSDSSLAQGAKYVGKTAIKSAVGNSSNPK